MNSKIRYFIFAVVTWALVIILIAFSTIYSFGQVSGCKQGLSAFAGYVNIGNCNVPTNPLTVTGNGLIDPIKINGLRTASIGSVSGALYVDANGNIKLIPNSALPTETVTSLDLSGNILTFTDEQSAQNSYFLPFVDLSSAQTVQGKKTLSDETTVGSLSTQTSANALNVLSPTNKYNVSIKDGTMELVSWLGTTSELRAYWGTKTVHDLCLQTGDLCKLNIDATTGNIGIGTNYTVAINPATKLNVHEDNTTNGSYTKMSNRNTGIAASDGLDVGVSATGGGEIRLRENNTLDLFTNNTSRMQISALGNIGIGNASSTTSKLGLLNNGAFTTDSYGIVLTNSATSSTALVNKCGMNIVSTGTWLGASAENIGLKVQAIGGTTNYAALFTGGNVGIGTNTPTGGMLHIQGAGATIATNALVVHNSTGTSNSLIVRNDGKVSIGKILAATAEALEVGGSVKADMLKNNFAATTANFALSTGAGTGATINSVRGGNSSFSITFTTGTLPSANAVVFGYTASTSYGSTFPSPVFSAGNANAAEKSVFSDVGSGALIRLNSTTTALNPLTQYTYHFIIIGN